MEAELRALKAQINPHFLFDRGPGFPTRHTIGDRPGHGLHNVDQRLRKTYGPTHGLAISVRQPRGTIVTVSIPVGARE